jgi:hypothetical protein
MNMGSKSEQHEGQPALSYQLNAPHNRFVMEWNHQTSS